MMLHSATRFALGLAALGSVAISSPTPAHARSRWASVNVAPGQDNMVLALAATDDRHAWALATVQAANGSRIIGLRTVDGVSWQSMFLPGSGGMFPPLFTALGFVNDQIGVLGGTILQGFTPVHKVWVTDNGGLSWTEGATLEAGPILQFQILPTGDIYAVGGGVFMRSLDGIGWTFAAPPSAGANVTPQGVHMLNQNCGWLVGGFPRNDDNDSPSSGAVWHTSDGGASWQIVAQGLPYYLRRVQFVAGNRGFAVGEMANRGVIASTEDGGVTWIEQTVPDHPPRPDACVLGQCVDEPRPVNLMAELRFFDPLRGVALGLACANQQCDPSDSTSTYLSSFLRTYDGGASWQHDANYEDAMPDVTIVFSIPGEFARQISMAFPDPNHGFLGGQHQTILRYVAESAEAPSSALPSCDSNASKDGEIDDNGDDLPDGMGGGCGCQTGGGQGLAGLLLVALGLAITRRRLL